MRDYIIKCHCYWCRKHRKEERDYMGWDRHYIAGCECGECEKYRIEKEAEMKKVKLPRMKRQVGIFHKDELYRQIKFYANEAIAAQASDFGEVDDFLCRENSYEMVIDARYDFDDVVEWLESLA